MFNEGTRLHYDFSGFHPRYKTLPYATPDATGLARRLISTLSRTAVHEFTTDRGLDHGAFIPGQSSASGTYSGLSQNTGAFAAAFQPFATGSSGAGATGPATSGMSGKCLDDFGGSSTDGTRADHRRLHR